jgi:hypothetical protein
MGKKMDKQKTPKGHEIPIPTKEEFERNLDKVAKPKKRLTPRRPKK